MNEGSWIHIRRHFRLLMGLLLAKGVVSEGDIQAMDVINENAPDNTGVHDLAQMLRDMGVTPFLELVGVDSSFGGRGRL